MKDKISNWGSCFLANKLKNSINHNSFAPLQSVAADWSPLIDQGAFCAVVCCWHLAHGGRM
jgi:hypothetical protein